MVQTKGRGFLDRIPQGRTTQDSAHVEDRPNPLALPGLCGFPELVFTRMFANCYSISPGVNRFVPAARGMYMISRLLTLALCTLAAFGQSLASGGNARGQDAGTLTHVSRRVSRNLRIDQQDPPEPVAMQSAVIEDSEENSTSRSRANETRSPHDEHEEGSASHRSPSAHAYAFDLTANRPLIYRLCKLLI
jgi:hypothetical protein